MYINIAKVDFGRYDSGGEPQLNGLYITPADASTISVTPNDSYYTLHSKYLKYSFDGKKWNDWNGSVTIEPEKKMYLKGEDDYVWNEEFLNNELIIDKLITSDGYYNVGGDISSLTNEIADVKEYTFYSLFSDDNYIKDASNLLLPATTLVPNCYDSMFNGCTSLITAPELPATTLADYCYSSMFSGCTSLTTANALPATTLANNCYSTMFQGCTSLTTAPELPVTTLAEGCYASMFSGCTSLTTAPVLPATTLTTSCYSVMFSGCTSLTTAPELPATTLTHSCYYSMFSDCTSLTTAPVLPATTLTINCYSGMFQGCTSLTTAPELPATTLANNCYSVMFSGCTSLTTAPELPATTLADYCYNYMFSDCTSLTTAPVLPATTLANNCYSTMFQGCTSLTTAPELPATTLADECYSRMFSECSSLTTAPALPATTLRSQCYQYMFSRCTSLETAPVLPATTLAYFCYAGMFNKCSKINNITMLATDISASGCLSMWVYDVSSTGTFTKSHEMTSLPTGTSGIPKGWTVKDYGVVDYPSEYMTLSALGDGDITITIPAEINSTYATSLSYSKDKSTWNETLIDNTAQTISIPVTSGDNVYLKGVAKQLGVVGNGVNIISSADINASGNTMSLLYGDDYKDKVELPSGSSSTFAVLFSGNTHLINAKDLIIPTTTLSTKCYQEMFAGCNLLITAPELPATTLASYCYYNMFKDCTSLTTAPELHATTLADYCYSGMFQGCTSLTTAPELLATTLTKECYAYMFQGCTSLTTAPELPATTLAIRCYEWMFAKCSSLTTGPVLHVLTLTPGCYQSMFEDCTSLNNITMLATDISASDCLMHWVVGVASTGTFNKSAEMTTLPTGINGIPEGWTVKDYGAVDYSQEYFTITALDNGDITLHLSGVNTFMSRLFYSTDKSSWEEIMLSDPELVIPVNSGDNIYFKGYGVQLYDNHLKSGMRINSSCNINVSGNIMSLLYEDDFKDKTSLPDAQYTFTELFKGNTYLISAENLVLPATTLVTRCYQKMFNGCTALTTAPELPATTLAEQCYNSMFRDCTTLNSITMLATDISARSCLYNWVSGVASTGTFTKAAEMTSLPTGVNGIPEGWTVVDYVAA